MKHTKMDSSPEIETFTAREFTTKRHSTMTVTSYTNDITKDNYEQKTSILPEQSTKTMIHTKTDVTQPNIDVTQSMTGSSHSDIQINTDATEPNIGVIHSNTDVTNPYTDNTMGIDGRTTSEPMAHITQLYVKEADITERLTSEISKRFYKTLHLAINLYIKNVNLNIILNIYINHKFTLIIAASSLSNLI